MSSKIMFYIESRGGEYPETIFFGLQYYLKMRTVYENGEILIDDSFETIRTRANK